MEVGWEDRALQVCSCRAGDETGEILMEEKKESENHLSESRTSVSTGGSP